MPRFFCALPNVKKAGRIPVLVTDDPAAITAFIRRWDKPGHGVFACLNSLRSGATRRSIETIGAIEQLAVDLDLKDLTATPEEVEERLRGLPLAPTWVRRSGGGFHVGLELREPVEASDAEYFQQTCDLHKRLVAALSGDPAVAHPAALLRVEGTCNTKRSTPIRCERLWGSGKPVDLSEIEALIELLPSGGMFERRGGGNGRDPHPLPVTERTAPVDVDARLAAMKFQGAGDSAIHTTQLQVTAALLRTGSPLDDVVADVLAATKHAVADDRRTAGWDWKQEEHDIRRMCADFISKAPELSAALPERLRTPFEATLTHGRVPKIVFSRLIGWHVRGFDPKNGRQDTGSPTARQQRGDSPEHGSAARTSGWSYYDSTETTPPRWLVKRLLPETGVGILAGQWGSFKTTTALDLAVSVMTGQAFAGQFKVKRRGAVLYFAVEGAGTLKARLEAIARHRGAPENLPFAWRGECPVLTARGAGQAIVKCVDEAAVHFEHAYGVPITLIWIDTYVTAAGLSSSGDDNDVAATQKAFTELRFVAASTGAFVAVVDHYGKILEAGTRGSSGKEGNADTVLATLAERELTGAVANTRMAARKQRDGVSGFEVPYTPEKVELGLDEDGDPITAIVLDWGKQQGERPGPGRKPKHVRMLCQVLAEVTADKGFAFQPDPGGPVVQAVHRRDLLAAFNERCHAEGDAKQKRKKRWAAYSRAMTAAVAAALIGVRDNATGEEVIWARR